MNMQRSVLKISIISLVLLSNAIFGMIAPIDSKYTKMAANHYKKFSPHYAESIFIKAQKNNTPLEKVLTPIQLSILANKYFKQSMPSLDLLISDKDTRPLSFQSRVNELYDKDRQKYIDTIQSQRLDIFLALPANDARRIIHGQFKKMDEYLANNEIDMREKLRQFYNIDAQSENDWKIYIEELSARNKFDIESMKQPWTNSTWDCGLSKIWVDIIKDAIEENGLEPTAFDIVIKDKSSTIASFMRPRSKILSVKSIKGENSKEEIIYEYQKNLPAYIELNPNISMGPNHNLVIKHVIHHELTHGLKGHWGVNVGVINAIHNKTKIKREDIELHPIYAKFMLAQEWSADVLPSLKDPKIAQCALLSPHFYPRSCDMTAAANANWKALELIKEK